MGTVDGNIEYHKLVGKYDERVKENPPDKQYQEVQRAEVELLLLLEVGSQGNCRDERHHVNKENHVSDERLWQRPTQNYLVKRPQRQVGGPQQAARGH